MLYTIESLKYSDTAQYSIGSKALELLCARAERGLSHLPLDQHGFIKSFREIESTRRANLDINLELRNTVKGK